MAIVRRFLSEAGSRRIFFEGHTPAQRSAFKIAAPVPYVTAALTSANALYWSMFPAMHNSLMSAAEVGAIPPCAVTGKIRNERPASTHAAAYFFFFALMTSSKSRFLVDVALDGADNHRDVNGLAFLVSLNAKIWARKMESATR